MKRSYSGWRPWYKKVRDFFIRNFYECPACNGEGGEKEIILDDGSGPFYPCNYCDKSGVVLNPLKRLQWWWWTVGSKKYKGGY